MRVIHLYVASGHSFSGHHGRPAGVQPIIEVPEVECVAGRGIRGDRYFGHQQHFKGQITFFARETYEELCRQLGIQHRSPAVFRRNVITQGADLLSLVGRTFEVQGVRFEGVEECKPCYWMNEAFGPGAEDALRGRGGLRARILSDGVLRCDGGPEDRTRV